MADDLTPTGELGPLDKFYRDNFVIGIILSVCCALIGFVLSLIAFLTAKDPTGKGNAKVCLIIAGVLIALSIVLNILGVFGSLLAR
jgi:hypothetical protein